MIFAFRAPPEFAATEYWIVPLPVPDAPEVIVTNEAELFVAVHGQVGRDAITFTDPVPAAVGKFAEFELRVKKQVLAAFCVMGNAMGPIRMEPVCGPPVFADTE